jgi:hypothetical protein
VEKNIVESDRPQMTIWRMRIACWIPKDTKTHSEYVIFLACYVYRYIACLAEDLITSLDSIIAFSLIPCSEVSKFFKKISETSRITWCAAVYICPFLLLIVS